MTTATAPYPNQRHQLRQAHCMLRSERRRGVSRVRAVWDDT